MRLSTSVLLALLLAGQTFSQAFGRFGYGGPVTLPGMTVDGKGFSCSESGSPSIDFLKPSKVWQCSRIDSVSEVVNLTGGTRCPMKFEFDLYSPGFRAYFGSGIDLVIHSSQSPFISWAEGSVGDGVPSPPVKWVIVSFKDEQAPFLLSFEIDRPCSLTIRGTTGEWHLSSESSFAGWVRICLPNGSKPFKTNSAATLGALTQRFLKDSSFWLASPTKLISRKVESDNQSVTCTWKFDRPGVVVPPAAILSQIGGYPAAIVTRTRQLPAVDEYGPLVITDQEDLTIRFPIRRVPVGRFVAEGNPRIPPAATVAPLDVPSVIELGLANLVGTCDDATKRLGEQTLSSYLEQANYFSEPLTGQQLPFNAAGQGADVAAANAFLMQALTSTRQATSEANSLLTSLDWRQDWLTWSLWNTKSDLARRAGAFAALAGALCPEPERRLDAAMFQAGLAAERGLNTYRRRIGKLKTEPPLIEPMAGLRQILFALNTKLVGEECDFARAMLSEVRVFGPTPVFVRRKQGTVELVWSAGEQNPSTFLLASAYPLGLTSDTNLAGLDVKDAFGFTRVQYRATSSGSCIARFSAPEYARAIPAISEVPQYSEPAR